MHILIFQLHVSKEINIMHNLPRFFNTFFSLNSVSAVKEYSRMFWQKLILIPMLIHQYDITMNKLLFGSQQKPSHVLIFLLLVLLGNTYFFFNCIIVYRSVLCLLVYFMLGVVVQLYCSLPIYRQKRQHCHQ